MFLQLDFVGFMLRGLFLFFIFAVFEIIFRRIKK